MHVAYFPAEVLVLLVAGPGYFRGPGVYVTLKKWLRDPVSSGLCWAGKTIPFLEVFVSYCCFFTVLHRLYSRSMYDVSLCLVGVFFCLWQSNVHSKPSTSQTNQMHLQGQRLPISQEGHVVRFLCLLCVFAHSPLMFVQPPDLWLEVPELTASPEGGLQTISRSLGQICIGSVPRGGNS